MNAKEMQQRSIYGTPEEKLKLLEQDPSRFYIQENLWLPRGKDRINLLEDMLKDAIKIEAYELCSEIVRVRDILQARMEQDAALRDPMLH